MISFKKIGNYGRLGNQIFQYAFIRSQAKRLGVKFYCPDWIGDNFFDLNDEKDRVSIAFEPAFFYHEYDHGYNEEAVRIKDNTDVMGFFQSEKYFSRDDIYRWFSFRKEIIFKVDNKYPQIDFSEATAMHIRLGDYQTSQLTFYTPRAFYFKKALTLLDHKQKILVFSDDPDGAKKYLKNIPGNFIFIEGNKDYEDLYLMSKCRNIICSPSSLSWWASYLNKYTDKKIIVPEYWYVPGGKAFNNDIFVTGWIRLRAHRIFFDNYYVRFIPFKMEVYFRRIIKSIKILKVQGLKGLYNYFRDFRNR